MKLTTKELRECAKGEHWCGSENRPAMATELLALRASERRFRKATKEARNALLMKEDLPLSKRVDLAYEYLDEAMKSPQSRARKK